MATKQLPALPEATTAEDNDLLLKRDDSSGSDQKLSIQTLRDEAFGDAAVEDVSVTPTPDTLAKRDSIGRIQAASGGSGNETVVHDDTSTAPNAETIVKRTSGGGITAAFVNTGQGDNELHQMDQAVRTIDDVQFNKVTANSFVGVDQYSDQDALDLFNVSGSAPVYACRAWVNFDGTGTVAIRESGNVSSITDNGIGNYTLNFSTAMQDANYSICGQVDSFGSPGSYVYTTRDSVTASNITVECVDSTGSDKDPLIACFAIFR